MSSILRQKDVLVAIASADLTDSDWATLQNQLLAKTRATRAQFVLLDVSAIDTMDSFATRMLRGLSRSIELLGARPIVVGIQPDVAFAMAQLGLRLDTDHIALDLDDGLAIAERMRSAV